MAYKFNPFTGTLDEKLDTTTEISGNVVLNDNYISNDGDNEGIIIEDSGTSSFISASTGALSFTGGDEYLNLGAITELQLVSNFTISMWHYNDASGEQILWKYNLDADNYIQLKLTAGRQIRLDWIYGATYVEGEQGFGALPTGFKTNTNLYMDADSDPTGDLNKWNNWTVVFDGNQTPEFCFIGNNTRKFFFNQVAFNNGTSDPGRISWEGGYHDLLSQYWYVGDIIHISGTTDGSNDGIYTVTAVADGNISSIDVERAFPDSGEDDNSDDILISCEPKRIRIYKDGQLLKKTTDNNLTWSVHGDITSGGIPGLAFVHGASTGDETITRNDVDGSFIDDGFQSGMRITISGADETDNNGNYVLDSVEPLKLTVADNTNYSFANTLVTDVDSNSVTIICNTFKEKNVSSHPNSGAGLGYNDIFPPATMTAESSLWIGSSANSLKGLLGEVSLWDASLSAAEALTLYDNGHPYDSINIRKYNLIGYWKMDSLTGNSVPNSVPWSSLYPGTAYNDPTLDTGIKTSAYKNTATSVDILRVPLNVNNNYISGSDGILLESRTADGSGGVYVSPDGKVSLMDISSSWITQTSQGQIGVLAAEHIAAFETDNWSVSQWVNHWEKVDDVCWEVHPTNTGAECHNSGTGNTNYIKFWLNGNRIEVLLHDFVNASSIHDTSKRAILESSFIYAQDDPIAYNLKQWYHYVTVFDISKKVTTGNLTNITVDASALTITRADGSFLTDGFTVGMKIHFALTPTGNYDETIHKISAVVALIITVEADNAGPDLVTDASAGENVIISSVGLECLTVYRDGVKLDLNIAVTSTGMTTSSPIEIAIPLTHDGSNDSMFVIGGMSQTFSGAIGETAIWRSSLSAANVLKLYDHGFPYAANGVDATNLISYWKMKGQISPVDTDGVPDPSDETGYVDASYDTWITANNNAEGYDNAKFYPSSATNHLYGGRGHRIVNSFGAASLHLYVQARNDTEFWHYQYSNALSCAASQMTIDGFDMLRGDMNIRGNKLVQVEAFIETSMSNFDPNSGTGSSNIGQLITINQANITASGKTTTNTGLSSIVKSNTPTMVGTVNNVGVNIDVLGAGSGTQDALGLSIKATGADTNTHIKCLYDATNYMTIATGANGATTLTTVDSDGTSADLVLDADGDIKLEPATGKSILLDGRIDIDAGVITGVTELAMVYTGTTANVIDIQATALTSGSALLLNVDDSLTTSETKTLLSIDYDKTEILPYGVTNQTTGLGINLHKDSATNHVISTVRMIGAEINIDSDSAAGTIAQTGLVLNVAVDEVGDDAETYGISMRVKNGGTDIKMASSANVLDYCSISTTLNGATTIETVDGDAALAHLTLDADGDIDLSVSGSESTVQFKNDDSDIFFKCQSSAASTKGFFYERGGRNGTDDYLTFSVFEHGATTFQTVDAAAGNANLQFYADGEIQFRSTTDDINIKTANNYTNTTIDVSFSAFLGGYWHFDYTGHADGEDIWYSSEAHGLRVGDIIHSDDSSNENPPEYLDATDYHVVNVPSTTTIQLSATSGGSVIAGSVDSGTGNSNKWFFKKYKTIIQPKGDIQINSSGSITLDGTGDFIHKNNGTEFSAANSAYAGMILGYTTVGKDAAPAHYNVSVFMLPVHNDLKVTFKAPPSGAVEIFISITVDSGQGTRSLELGLSTTDRDAGFLTLDNQYENFSFLSSGLESFQHTHRWVVTGLTPNAIDTYWLAASAESSRIDVRWGGQATSTGDTSEPYEYAPFIMKVTALPAAVADYAVYG